MQHIMTIQAKSLMRGERRAWHRGHATTDGVRLRQFLRIARGYLA